MEDQFGKTSPWSMDIRLVTRLWVTEDACFNSYGQYYQMTQIGILNRPEQLQLINLNFQPNFLNPLWLPS